MRFLQAINSDLNVFIVCNKTGGTITVNIKKKIVLLMRGESNNKFMLCCSRPRVYAT